MKLIPMAPATKFVRAFLEVGGSRYSLDLVMFNDTYSITRYHLAEIHTRAHMSHTHARTRAHQANIGY